MTSRVGGGGGGARLVTIVQRRPEWTQKAPLTRSTRTAGLLNGRHPGVGRTSPRPGAGGQRHRSRRRRQLGIAVTGADTANGSWWYSTTGGSTWNALGAVSDAGARLLAADADHPHLLPAQPGLQRHQPGRTFRAWDQTAGSNGGTADTTSATSSVRDDFTAVSYANNDGTASWSTSWVDADGNPAAGNVRVTGGSSCCPRSSAPSRSTARSTSALRRAPACPSLTTTSSACSAPFLSRPRTTAVPPTLS